MKKYMFIALFYAFGLVAVPQPGYAKLAVLSDSELGSVTAQAGFANAPGNSGANLVSEIDVNGLRKDGVPVDDVHINNKGSFNFLPFVSCYVTGKHDVVEFDIDFEKVTVDVDNISVGIGPIEGTDSSLINYDINNLHVEMTGSVHVSVR